MVPSDSGYSAEVTLTQPVTKLFTLLMGESNQLLTVGWSISSCFMLIIASYFIWLYDDDDIIASYLFTEFSIFIHINFVHSFTRNLLFINPIHCLHFIPSILIPHTSTDTFLFLLREIASHVICFSLFAHKRNAKRHSFSLSFNYLVEFILHLLYTLLLIRIKFNYWWFFFSFFQLNQYTTGIEKEMNKSTLEWSMTWYWDLLNGKFEWKEENIHGREQKNPRI